MNRNLPTLVVTGALALTLTTAVYAEEKSYAASTTAPAPASVAPSAGLLNDWLRKQSSGFDPWDIGGQFRARYEVKANAGSFPNRDFIRSGQDNDNSYLLLRERAHAGYTPVSWFAAFVEARDSSSAGDDRNPNLEADDFDLHQAYVSVGDARAFPLVLKVGRQEMAYGDERFVGVSDWNNLGRVFDAGKLRFENEILWVDVFAGRIVIPRDEYFNIANDYDWFSGVYASSRKPVPWQVTDLYFLARNVSVRSLNAIGNGIAGPAPRDIYTIGARVKSLPDKLKGWDYSAECAGQFGSVNSGGVRLDQQALAADATVGYTWKDAFGSPRVGLGYTYASGDSNQNDNENQTFELLFGTNHKPYGVMDLWGLRNIHSPRAVMSFKPLKKLSLSGEYHIIWLAEGRDLFYPEFGPGRSANGYGRNPQFNDFVGSELDLLANCAVTRYADLQLGYGHFFVGDYIKQSVGSVVANNGATDADWFYVQMRFNF